MTELRQRHYRFRTDALAVDGTPTWGAAEDTDYDPGANNFRLRIGLSNALATATGSIPWQIYASKNGGAYAAVTTASSGGVQSVDAGASADDTAILIPRLTGLDRPAWVLEAAAVDLDFVNGRYFGGSLADLLSISRASDGYAKKADGTLQYFTSNQLRVTDLGLLAEDSRTNVVLHNRDMTDAVWAPTNMNRAKDQTGPDGVASSASSITATAGNATIMQSITLASSARYQSAWVKRITGSGTLEMTMDNGATWTAVTVTANWTCVEIPTQTLANPTVGFRIVTSGDAIAVDLVQNENGTFASSPIPTTTTSATRALDSITAIGSLNTLTQANEWSAFADSIHDNTIQTANIMSAIQNRPMRINSGSTANGQVCITDSVADRATATLGGGRLWTTGAKAAVGLSLSGGSIVGGGGTVATTATAIVPLPGTLSIHQSWFGYHRRMAFWNSRLADATLQSLTAL